MSEQIKSQAIPTSNTGGFSIPKPRSQVEEKVKENNPQDTEKEKIANDLAQEEEVKTSELKKLDYPERLKHFDLSIDDALKIIDDMLVNFKYVETLKIGHRVEVVFATRSTRFQHYLSNQIDAINPKKVGFMNQLMTEYQLAGSLERYGKIIFPELDDQSAEQDWLAAFDERFKFVKRLAGPVYVALCNKLVFFDLKMATVFSEGYAENF